MNEMTSNRNQNREKLVLIKSVFCSLLLLLLFRRFKRKQNENHQIFEQNVVIE